MSQFLKNTLSKITFSLVLIFSLLIIHPVQAAEPEKSFGTQISETLRSIARHLKEEGEDRHGQFSAESEKRTEKAAEASAENSRLKRKAQSAASDKKSH